MLSQTQPHRKRSDALHDGGWLSGPADEARAADVYLEDWVGPPVHVHRFASSYRVESTHFKTVITGIGDDGLKFKVGAIKHPNGL